MNQHDPVETRREEFLALATDLEQPLFAAGLRLTGRSADAEDLVQETWYRGFRSFQQFQRGTNFRAWMFRIQMNVFRNNWRRGKKAPRLMDFDLHEPGDRPHSVEEDFDAEGLQRLFDRNVGDEVKRAIDGLTEDHRAVLLMTSIGDLSYKEVAAALEIPVGTVMSRLHRARAQLKQHLAEYAKERRLIDTVSDLKLPAFAA
ncbi:MAG: sigma-70 family RNA polymerase sigma factor [Planctomycetota bacterium]|jgi:RNA polymerase sigma-70 factor (ECF subfamily)